MQPLKKPIRAHSYNRSYCYCSRPQNRMGNDLKLPCVQQALAALVDAI